MHKPTIDPEVVRRVIARRGGLRVFDSINCERTAHIIVDLQNGFMAPGAVAEIGTAREIVPSVNRISAALRDAWRQARALDRERKEIELLAKR